VLVVVTHWHDDHIRGITRVVTACKGASVACSSALHHKDTLQFVFETDGSGGALGSGLDELRSILRLPEAQRRLIWAKANTPLYPRPPGNSPQVVALSPSEDAFSRSLQALIEDATKRPAAVRRRFRAPEGANGASIAVSVRIGDDAVLLGADVETSSNSETGWDAILTYAAPEERASLVKVPHHASDGAHSEEVWTRMLVENVVAVVTPWALGDDFLPKETDLDRLRQLTGKLYLTSVPSLKRADKDRAVNRLIQRLHGGNVEQLRGWGHVRARRGSTSTEWHVELDGDAVSV
jgi:hypothetical protein